METGERSERCVQSGCVVDAVADAYGLAATAAPPRRLGGAINHVLRVATTTGDIVVRVHRAETTPERLLAVHMVQERLRGAGLPVAAILRTRDGAGWIVHDGRLVEVLDYVPGGHQVDSWDDAAVVFAALGNLHAALRPVEASDLPPPPFWCYAPPETALALLEANEVGFRAERAHPDYARADTTRMAVAALLRRLAAARRSYAASLPRLAIHGDFVGNNVLVEEGRVIAILDFDRLAGGDRIFDIARTLMAVLSRVVYPWLDNQPPVTSLTDGHLRAVVRLLWAYEEGSGWPLTSAEIGALPYELALAPLYPIAMAGSEEGQAVRETTISAPHVPIVEWLEEHAAEVAAFVHREIGVISPSTSR